MITPRHINKIVAEEFQITPRQLMSKSKLQTIYEARHAAMWICHQLLSLSSLQLKVVYNKKSHSTTLHAIERAQDLIDVDPLYKARIDRIVEKIKSKSEELKEVKQRYNLHHRLKEKQVSVNCKTRTVSLRPEEEERIQSGQLRKLLSKHRYSVQYSIV